MVIVGWGPRELMLAVSPRSPRYPWVVFVFTYWVGLKMHNHTVAALGLALAVLVALPKPYVCRVAHRRHGSRRFPARRCRAVTEVLPGPVLPVMHSDPIRLPRKHGKP